MTDKTVEQLLETFEQFKRANDEQHAETKRKLGSVDPLLASKVDKTNEAIDKLIDQVNKAEAEAKAAKAAAEAIELAMKRPGAKGMSNAGIEEKAMDEFRAMLQSPDATEADFKAHRAAVNAYLRKGRQDIAELQAKAMSVDSNPDGGFFVTPDTSGRIVQLVYETSPMRQVASVQTISTDKLEGTYDLDEAEAGWVSERGTRNETGTPQINRWEIPVHEMYAEPRATQKLLDDSSVNIEQWLAGKVASKFSRQENTAFVTGNGVGKPRGFLTYPAGTPTADAIRVIQQINTGASGTFAASNPADFFMDVIGALKEVYLSGARWAMNRSTKAAVRKLKDADGAYLFAMDFSQGVRETVLGYAVTGMEDMPAIAADSLSIAFGNFAEAYQIVDRMGVRVLRDPFTAKPWVKFYTTKRVGGDVVNFEALKLVKFAA
nr:phage major capsid protein [uncultured Roseateles sp.]